MDQNRIAELLRPFLGAQALSSEQLALVSTYIELLLRWNTRVNLTALRDPESIVSRHFGESLFLAAHLFSGSSPAAANNAAGGVPHALDLGSGAGFPGLPLKIFFPDLRLTLVESNRKKAAFLAEVIRALGMSGAQVSSGRLELAHRKDAQLVPPPGIEPPSLVTLRAVERFESAVRTAAALVRYGSAQRKGTLALLIGGAQASQVPKSIHDFTWDPAALVPQSAQRVLLVGRYSAGQEPGK